MGVKKRSHQLKVKYHFFSWLVASVLVSCLKTFLGIQLQYLHWNHWIYWHGFIKEEESILTWSLNLNEIKQYKEEQLLIDYSLKSTVILQSCLLWQGLKKKEFKLIFICIFLFSQMPRWFSSRELSSWGQKMNYVCFITSIYSHIVALDMLYGFYVLKNVLLCFLRHVYFHGWQIQSIVE